MTARYTGGSSRGYDYVQPGEPSDPDEGEEWYDTDANQAYVFDGAAWVELTVTDHGQLSGVSASDHHAKPTGGDGVGFVADANEFVADLGNGLGIDANGQIAVLSGAIGTDEFGDTVDLPVYATEGDLPAASEGSIAYVSDTGEIYVEDGT